MIKGLAGMRWGLALVSLLGTMLWSGAAQASKGQPTDYQLNLQDAVTPVAEQMHTFHNLLLVIITVITLFVLALLVIVMVRFNARANPTPSRNTHNTTLEVLWTVLPIVILVVIAIPSFKLLYQQYSYPEPDLTIKATGHQWYWSYEYPDHENIAFDAFMVEDDQLKPGQPRLLAADNEVVVPVGKVVYVLVTASDVLHNWTVPSFGSKIDAVPGRVTSTWFQATEEGVFYGQCSELCGIRHAFMPIAVRVVDQATFDDWTAAMEAEDEDRAKSIIEAAARRLDERNVAELADD